jgi:hypothetical protein
VRGPLWRHRRGGDGLRLIVERLFLPLGENRINLLIGIVLGPLGGAATDGQQRNQDQ